MPERKPIDLAELIPQLKPYKRYVKHLKDVAVTRAEAVSAYTKPLLRNHHMLKRWERLNDYMMATADVTTVLISISVSCWSGDRSVIREVGIAVYDPAAQKDEQCQFINAHLLLRKTEDLVSRAVVDHRDHFLFGDSIVLPREEITAMLNSILAYYAGREDMKAALVCHTTDRELHQLKKLSVTVPSNINTFDIYELQRCTIGMEASSLGQMLRGYDIDRSFFYNAGNSSQYVLWLMMRVTDPEFRKDFQLDTEGAYDWYMEQAYAKEDGPRPKTKKTMWKRFTYAEMALQEVYKNVPEL